jgi:hypothetical protein
MQDVPHIRADRMIDAKARNWLIGLAVVLAALLAGTFVLRAPLASLAVKTWLAWRGFPGASVSVIALDIDRAEIARLDLGSGLLSAKRIVIRYRLQGMGGFDVRSVRGDGLRLQIDTADTASLTRLAALLPEGKGASGIGSGPVIQIDDAALSLRTSAGDVFVRLDAAADLSKHPARATLKAEGSADFGSASLTAEIDDLLGAPMAQIDGKVVGDLGLLPFAVPLSPSLDRGTITLDFVGSVPLPAPGEDAIARWLAQQGNVAATVSLLDAAIPPYAEELQVRVPLRLQTGKDRLHLILAEPATLSGRVVADIPFDRVQRGSLVFELGSGSEAASGAKATIAGSLSADRIDATLTGSVSWAPERPIEAPLAVLADLRGQGLGAGRARVPALSWKANGTISGGRVSLAGPLDARIRTGEEKAAIAVTGRLGVDGTASVGRARLSGGTARLPDPKLAVRDLAVSIPWPLKGNGDVALSGSVTDMAAPARFAPLAVSARLTPEADNVALSGEIIAARGALKIPVSGRYASGEGRLSLGPATLEFSKSELHPARLSDRLAAVRQSSGAVEARAQLSVKEGSVDGTAEIGLRDLTVGTQDLLIDGLDGTVRLDGLLPPRTAGVQTVTARQAVVGLPLDQVAVDFELVRAPSGTVVEIRRARGRVAGGTVTLGDVRIDPSAARHTAEIRIDGVDLATLLEDWAMDGLAGTGRLSGVIPVAVGPDGVAVRDGVLRSQGNGTLRVNWGDAREALLRQNENVALMVRTLEDFRYSLLEVQLSRPPDGSLSLRVRLEGHNPAVKDGHPFRFIIAFSGDLEEILAAVREGRRLGGALLKGGLDFAR